MKFLLYVEKCNLGEIGKLNIRVGLYLAPFLKLPASENLWHYSEAPEGWNLTQLRCNEYIDQYSFEILKKMTEINRMMI